MDYPVQPVFLLLLISGVLKLKYQVLAFFRTLARILTVCHDGSPDGPRSSGSPALPSDAELSHSFS